MDGFLDDDEDDDYDFDKPATPAASPAAPLSTPPGTPPPPPPLPLAMQAVASKFQLDAFAKACSKRGIFKRNDKTAAAAITLPVMAAYQVIYSTPSIHPSIRLRQAH